MEATCFPETQVLYSHIRRQGFITQEAITWIYCTVKRLDDTRVYINKFCHLNVMPYSLVWIYQTIVAAHWNIDEHSSIW
jgi:hypothetical protein